LHCFGRRREACKLTPMELVYAVTMLQRQPVSLLRMMAQQASVGDGGLSPSTAGRQIDMEDREPEHAPVIAPAPLNPSATRIAATSGTSAWNSDDRHSFLLFIVAFTPDKPFLRRFIFDRLMELRR
jgi:hypothetical protein